MAAQSEAIMLQKERAMTIYHSSDFGFSIEGQLPGGGGIRDHKKCAISTGICGSITAGQGRLDENGYFEYPCFECAKRVEENKLANALERVWQSIGFDVQHLDEPMNAITCGRACMDYL